MSKEQDIEEILKEKSEELNENKSVEEDIFDDLNDDDIFGDMEDSEKVSEMSEEEVLEIGKDVHLDENVQEVVEAEEPEEEELEMDELDEVLFDIVANPNYPAHYPQKKELRELKKKHRELIFIEVGGIVEKITYDTDVKIYICTTFKHTMIDKFREEGLPDDKFSDFIIESSTLYPKLNAEDVEGLSVGEYFPLLQNIKSKSYLNGGAAVIKV